MEVNIHTNLLTHPMPKEVLNYIQLGTTPTLTFDLNNRIYTFEDISQVIFIFHQGDVLKSYSMIEYATENDPTNWTIDDHFVYNKLLNTINFTFTSAETLQFKPSKLKQRDTYVNFQIVIKLLLDGQEQEIILNNPEDDIFIIDTLYSHTISI